MIIPIGYLYKEFILLAPQVCKTNHLYIFACKFFYTSFLTNSTTWLGIIN